MNIQTETQMENQMENAQFLSINYNNQSNQNQVEINYQLSQGNIQQQGYQHLQENIQNQFIVQQDIQIQQQQIPVQQIQLQTQLLTPQQAIQILSQNPIPDQFVFQNDFIYFTPNVNCCGGRFLESSTFVLPSIGELKWEIDFTLPCRCCESNDTSQLLSTVYKNAPKSDVQLDQSQRRCCCYYYPCHNIHHFSGLTYYLINDQVRIEFSNKVGKLYILGVLIFELIECYPDLSDHIQSSYFSTMPQMIIYQPQTSNAYKLRVKAEKNNCPEDPYSILGWQSLCGCCKFERKFEFFGLNQGECQILNRRQKCDACYSQCGYREKCCCDGCNFVDYPVFEVKFNNVDYVDRLKILFCLVHHSMYNKWRNTGYKGINLDREFTRIIRSASGAGSSCQLI